MSIVTYRTIVEPIIIRKGDVVGIARQPVISCREAQETLAVQQNSLERDTACILSFSFFRRTVAQFSEARQCPAERISKGNNSLDRSLTRKRRGRKARTGRRMVHFEGCADINIDNEARKGGAITSQQSAVSSLYRWIPLQASCFAQVLYQIYH